LYIEQVTGAVTLTFFATDTEGNEEVYSPTYTLTKDETAPTIIQMYNEEGGDELYLKDGTNSVYADFDPTGSAFSLGNAYLTFSLANLNKMDATSCWENGAYWSCVWNFSMSYSGTSSSTLYIDAEDDAGNTMEQYDTEIQIDSEEPEIISMTRSLDCPTGSDSLIIEINATDDSDELYATFYGEDVRTSNDPITEECSEIMDGMFTCFITVNDLVSYSEDEDVTIEISDLAGNIADDELDISVCELEQTGTPNLVTMYMEDVSPIDKLTLSYIDYPLYLPLTFSMTSGAHIVSKTASCEDASMYFIDQSETSTIAILTIPKQVVANGTYSLREDCTISMTMQYGDNVYMNPEIENVSIDVELYGTPLGSIEESIAQKIEWQKMGIADKQKKIDGWVKANQILGILCNLGQLLAKLDAVLGGVRLILTAIAAIVYEAAYVPPASFVATPVYEGIVAYETFANGYHAFISEYVWPPGPFVDWGIIMKWICIVYTGKLCEGFDGIINKVVVSADEYGTPAYYEQNNNGETSDLVNRADESGWPALTIMTDWDPYKSIHTAANCLYIDAIIYNLRKERQINCMYTKCLEENAKLGLPTDICDVQYKERECLYFDGAVWLAAGGAPVLHGLQMVLNTALANAEVLALGIIYTLTCGVWEVSLLFKVGIAVMNICYMATPYLCPVPEGGYGMFADTACHVYAGGLELVETDWLMGGFDWDFQANLEGTDYCVGYE
jgi:hypothetical protein